MCMCDWSDGCGGTGVLYCDGCGGDICICRCGGEMPCDGCEDCGDGQIFDDVYDGDDATTKE